MLCKKRVHALFSEMIMTSLTAEFPTLQDREGTSEMGSAHAKHLDSRESKLQRPCLNFTPQFSNTCQGNYLLFGNLPLCIHVLSLPVIQFSHRQETVLTHHHALCCGSKRWKQPRILSQLYHQ